MVSCLESKVNVCKRDYKNSKDEVLSFNKTLSYSLEFNVPLQHSKNDTINGHFLKFTYVI